jgi:hypothetical protein
LDKKIVIITRRKQVKKNTMPDPTHLMIRPLQEFIWIIKVQEKRTKGRETLLIGL